MFDLLSVIGIAQSASGLSSAASELFKNGLKGVTLQGVRDAVGQTLPFFEKLGAVLAPGAAPDVHGILGVISALAGQDEVLAAQRAINAIGTHVTGWKPIEEDGIYGPETAAGVTMVQVFLHLKPDSWYGPILSKAINTYLAAQTPAHKA